MLRPDGGPDSSISHRLISMRKSIAQLQSFGELTPSLLSEKPHAGLVAERMIFLLGNLAEEINAILARTFPAGQARGASAPFFASSNAGAIDARLARQLEPEDGPHHVLVQLSLDSDPAALAGIVAEALAAYDAYVAQLADWLERRTLSDQTDPGNRNSAAEKIQSHTEVALDSPISASPRPAR